MCSVVNEHGHRQTCNILCCRREYVVVWFLFVSLTWDGRPHINLSQYVIRSKIIVAFVYPFAVEKCGHHFAFLEVIS